MKSVEMREVNDIPADHRRRPRDGRRALRVPSHDLEHHGPGPAGRAGRRRRRGQRNWPVHEVGRNADIFPDDAGKLLKAGSSLVFDSVHIHSNGRDTKAHLSSASSSCRRTTSRPCKYARRGPRQRRRHRHAAERSQPAARRLHRAAGEHQDHFLRAAPARAGRAHVPGSDLGLQHPDALLSATTTTGFAATTTTTTLRRCCRRAPSCTSSATWTLAGEQERAGSAQLVGFREPLDREHVHRPRQGVALTDEQF